ncbi:DNA-binding protein [Klebsiella pneumoniae]|nr:hypothetical protein [Klebsiella pneumoniae]SXB92675.1 DNA-binding protein [Klebsiella pneumoniae]
MSATESKVKTAPKTSKKTLKSAEAEALKVALDAAQVEYVPVSALVKSPLNVRTVWVHHILQFLLSRKI